MTKLRRLVLLLTIVVFACCTSSILAQGKVSCSTTWDNYYFYAAFHVDDPNVVGTNSKLDSNPWEDDSIEIFLETDNQHHPGRSKNAFSMAVSVANGSAFTVGGEDGKWQKKTIVSFKYMASIDGSLNSSDDIDEGYTIEIALPWVEMGLTPPTPGTMMSFNVISRLSGETRKFVSLSPNVKSEEDIQDASKWVDIVFTGPTFGAATLSVEKIVSAQYVTKRPLVDGQMKPSEYNKNTSFDLKLPFEISRAPRYQIQKLAMTYYFYWYQADPRKASPVSHVRSADGKSMLTDQPANGTGPWFSYDNVQWHKDELSDVRKAGLDIVLPVYWGDASNSKLFSRKGLDCMVEALRELKTEGKPYPLVGMFFDTTAMNIAYGSKPDLKDEEVKKTFYGMIRDFFDRVPDEFRAQVVVDEARAAKPCYIIHLYTSNWFSDLDPSFVEYINSRFMQDYGATICWMGAKDYRPKADNLDAYCSYGAGQGLGFDDSAKIKVAAIGPGYDDSPVVGRTSPIRSRNGGNAYMDDWISALTKKPNWIVVDGWNEFHEGSDICASRQYGSAYIDITGKSLLQFRGNKGYSAKFFKHDVPAVIPTEEFCQVNLLVQNDGNEAWRVTEGFAISYRWYKNGELIGDSGIRRPIQKDVLPGQLALIPIGVAAVKKGGGRLEEGNYEVRFEMMRLGDEKWFSALGSAGLVVPVQIGKTPEVAGRFVSVDGPVMMKTATPYKYKVQIRNDGSTIWKAGTGAVTCRLFRVSNYVHGWTTDSREEVEIAPIKVVLGKDVKPGQVADLAFDVNLKDSRNKPIPVWSQDQPWSYQLRFEVWDGKKCLTDAGVRPCDRIVDVFDADYGLKMIAANVPTTIEAGQTIDVEVVYANQGPDNWDPKKQKIGFGYHWYHLDGTEVVWNGEVTPLQTTARSGQPGVSRLKVTAPQYDGQYILAIDLKDGDRWASTADITRGGNLLIAEVTVQNGKLAFVDLNELCDRCITSVDTNRTGGDFDGSGASFPREFFLPEAGLTSENTIYPAGYLWAAEPGVKPAERVSFKYPAGGADQKNAVTCNGQLVTVAQGAYSKLHVLAASVSGEQQASFTVNYANGTSAVATKVDDWCGEPSNGATAGFVSLHRHSASGDERGKKCSLFHYTLKLDSSKQLAGIKLPENDKVRVAGMTLERP